MSSKLVGGACFLVLLAPALAAQSVASGFGPEVYGGGQVVDDGVFGGVRPATADFDADGRADLVIADGSLTGLVRFLGQPGGGLGDRLLLPIPDLKGDFLRAFTGDFNGDGHADALSYATLSGAVSFFAGQGDGTFAAATDATFLPASMDAVSVGDVDEDGVLDLVWAAGFTGPYDVLWSPGLGAGTFAAPGRVGSAILPKLLIVADLTGDGLPDIAALSNGQVVAFPAVAAGQFGPPALFSSFAAGSLQAVDMDRDGHIDLVHGGTADTVTILHGDGAGGFGSPLYVSVGVGVAWDARAVDLDLDGFADLLCAGEFPTSLRARRMQPDGPIGLAQAYALPVDNPITGAVPADFDGDGLLDVATTGFSTGELAVSTNALGPFVDYGFAVASPQGTPHLDVSGTPAAGQVVSAAVGLPSPPTLGLLVVGLTAQDVPLLGSTFVPSLDASFIITVPGTAFVGIWPAGFPAATPVYLQAMFSLAGGGKTISNAVLILSE